MEDTERIEKCLDDLEKVFKTPHGPAMVSILFDSARIISQGHMQKDDEMMKYGVTKFIIYTLMNHWDNCVINKELQTWILTITSSTNEMFVKPSEPFDGNKMQSEFNIKYNDIYDKLHTPLDMIKAGITSNLLNPENCKIDIIDKHSTFLHIIADIIILKALNDNNIDNLRIGVNMLHIVNRTSDLSPEEIEESLKIAHILIPNTYYDPKARIELVEREMNRTRAIHNSVIRPTRNDLFGELVKMFA